MRAHIIVSMSTSWVPFVFRRSVDIEIRTLPACGMLIACHLYNMVWAEICSQSFFIFFFQCRRENNNTVIVAFIIFVNITIIYDTELSRHMFIIASHPKRWPTLLCRVVYLYLYALYHNCSKGRSCKTSRLRADDLVCVLYRMIHQACTPSFSNYLTVHSYSKRYFSDF